jgi:hypothetical protein
MLTNIVNSLQHVMRPCAALKDAGSAMALLFDIPRAQQLQRQQSKTASDSPPAVLPGIPSVAFQAAAVALRGSTELEPHWKLLELALAQERTNTTSSSSSSNSSSSGGDAPQNVPQLQERTVPLDLLLQAALACTQAGGGAAAAAGTTAVERAADRAALQQQQIQLQLAPQEGLPQWLGLCRCVSLHY